jgi:XapX domain-containing protein
MSRLLDGVSPFSAFVSLAVGLLVGLLYAALRVKSPAPPIVALIGLFGMVLGEAAPGIIMSLIRRH